MAAAAAAAAAAVAAATTATASAATAAAAAAANNNNNNNNSSQTYVIDFETATPEASHATKRLGACLAVEIQETEVGEAVAFPGLAGRPKNGDRATRGRKALNIG